MNALKKYCHVLLLVAFVMSGISPACKVMYGSADFIEICTADGTLETIAVPNNQAPQKNHQNLKNDCAFCFSQTNLKLAVASSPDFSTPPLATYLARSSGTFVPKTQKRTSYDPRGPPASFI